MYKKLGHKTLYDQIDMEKPKFPINGKGLTSGTLYSQTFITEKKTYPYITSNNDDARKN